MKHLSDYAADLAIGHQQRDMTFREQIDRLQAKGGNSPIYTRNPAYYRPIVGPYRRHPVREFLHRRLEDAAVIAVAAAAMLAVTLIVRVLG